jgi:peptidoglycan hydrolase-like protein with peptidoglycan-binding domain
VDETEQDFEFDFFQDRPATAAAEEDGELLWEESVDDAPVRRATPPTPPQVVMRRRVAAAAAVALLLLIIIIVVVTSGGGGGGGSYRGYVNGVSPIASDSQQVGGSLAAVSGKDAVSKLDALIQQAVDDVTRLQALTPPATLTAVQSQALAALDLRLTGLQGLRDSLAQAQAGTTGTSWDAALSTQVDDLVASDLIWSRAVRNPANAVLQASGLGGVFPGSTFVGDRRALVKSLSSLLGSTASTSTTGPTLSLGSKGADVVAWQNGLNQWLQKTGSTQTLTADGTFGATTQTVTEQLQTAAGLSPDGIVGPSTRQTLQQALGGTKAPSTSGTTTTPPATPPATPTTTTTARTLKLGDSGQDVVDWQTKLNQWLQLTSPSATPLSTDGSFGAATQTATEQLQSQAGLTPTGQVAAATRQALTSAISKASPNRG